MFKKSFVLLLLMVLGNTAIASTQIPVSGSVESKCVVTQDIGGVFGNPAPGTLSTDPADGGVRPIVRFDVVQASYYKAVITSPDAFTESPALSDVVYWTGEVTVDQVSDSTMSSYDTDKVEYNNVTEIDLSVAGSTWFKIDSEVVYGVGRAFPGGSYQTAVVAECIAI